MAIRITESIPVQAFEIVRDAIASVLVEELTNQQALKELLEPLNVYVGRISPFQSSEILMINVLVDSSNVTSKNQSGFHDEVKFFIDVYCSAKQSVSDSGGFASTKRLDLYIGLVRYILQDHRLNTLALPKGYVMGTSVDGFENFESRNEHDAAFVKMSRLTFSVRLNNQQGLWSGINLAELFAEVKIDETDKGYKYETIIN